MADTNTPQYRLILMLEPWLYFLLSSLTWFYFQTPAEAQQNAVNLSHILCNLPIYTCKAYKSYLSSMVNGLRQLLPSQTTKFSFYLTQI